MTAKQLEHLAQALREYVEWCEVQNLLVDTEPVRETHRWVSWMAAVAREEEARV